MRYVGTPQMRSSRLACGGALIVSMGYLKKGSVMLYLCDANEKAVVTIFFKKYGGVENIVVRRKGMVCKKLMKKRRVCT